MSGSGVAYSARGNGEASCRCTAGICRSIAPRQLLVRVMAVLIAVAAALGAAAMPAAAAEPFDLRIEPESTSRYLEPGASHTNLGLCTTSPRTSASRSVTLAVPSSRSCGTSSTSITLCGSTYAYAQLVPRRRGGSPGSGRGLHSHDPGPVGGGRGGRGDRLPWFVPQQWVGDFDAPDVIRGSFELEVQLASWFLELATVTDITLWCYQPDGVQTEIGSIDAVGSDGRATVLGDSGPCPLGEHNLLDCRLTWLDPSESSTTGTAAGE